MSAELKPCPFCGGEPRRGPYDVHCYGTPFNRHVMIVLKHDEWNRRADLVPATPSDDYVSELIEFLQADPDNIHHLPVDEVAVLRQALAARTDQPAADTRVVTVAQLEDWFESIEFRSFTDPALAEIRAIIDGSAKP